VAAANRSDTGHNRGVTLAGLINTLKITGGQLKEQRVLFVGAERRDDVQRCPARNFLGMVAEQPVRHPSAAVVSGDREAVMAERRHHLDLIQRQRAFRIVDEILAGRRL
jgi:malic enzyme